MLVCIQFILGYDVSSHMTETDVLDGIVAAAITTLFVMLGVYSQRLAYKLFEHPKILEQMRLHSKTVMKLNASIVVVVVITSFIVTLNMAMVDYSYFEVSNATISNSSKPLDTFLNPCQLVEIPLLICQFNYFSQVIYSVFFLLWTAMVGAVLICVSRTHTISIRRFICQLEYDSFLRDQKLREKLYEKGSQDANDAFKSK